MEKMKKIYKILAILTIVLWVSSCGDEYLDVPPQGALTSGAFYKTMVQAEEAVTTAYGMFCKTTAWDRDAILTFGDVPSDDAEAGGDYENEVPGTEEFNRFTFLPTNGAFGEMYGILYRGIYFANMAMERIPEVLETDPNADPAIINQRIGELKFIRAINHLYLVQFFGEVPLVDHLLAPSEYTKERATQEELYTFIEQDLLEAIPMLKEKSELAPEDIGRATKGAAKALLARAYLFESSLAHYYPGDARFTGLTSKWQDVLDVCEDLIASNEYRLVGSDGETYDTWHGPQTNGYRFMFTVEGDNNDESIFEVQYINDEKNYANTRAGSLVQWTSPRYYTNASGIKTNTPYWGLGWPTQSLADEFEPGDIRFHTCIAQPGDSIQINLGINVPINFSNTATGYYMNKYTCSAAQFADAGGHGWQKSPANGKLLRLGEVYLMAAEAAIMLNRNDLALNYINAIRSRARACGGGTGPADLTGTITMDQLIHERRVEMAFEGRRFFDLVRWNKAVQTFQNASTPGGYPIIFESPKYDFYPLPAREITVSNGALEQRYGW
jgi:hypothetical protein